MTPAQFLRTLDQQATPGPWADWHPQIRVDRPFPQQDIRIAQCWYSNEDDEERAEGEPTLEIMQANAKLIVALRTLLPALADVIAEVEKNISLGKIDGTYTAYHRLFAEIEKIVQGKRWRLAAAVAEVEGKA